MSFEDYVQHIANKYKVAAAMAVLKSKPDDLTIEEHTAHLKAKIQNKIDIDCDVTPEEFLSSEDFEFQDTDFETQVIHENDTRIVGNCPKVFKRHDKTKDFTDVRDFNDIKASIAHNIEASVADTEASANDMQVDQSDPHGKQVDEANSLLHVLRTLQEIDQNAALEKVPSTSTQNTFCQASQSILTHMFDKDAEIINFDVDTSTSVSNLENDCLQIINDSNNCIFDDRIVNKVTSNLNKGFKVHNSESNMETNQDEKADQHEISFSYDFDEDLNNYKLINNVDTNESVKREFVKEKAATVARNIRNGKNESVTTVIEYPDEVPTNNQTQNVIDTQATILYSLHGFTEDNTQISQSQNENIEFSGKNKADVTGNYSQNAFPSNIADANQTRVITIDSSQLKYIIDKNTGKTYAVLPSINFDSNNELNFQEDATESTKETNFQNSEDSRYGTSQTDEDFDKNEESSDKETVPFKVIKELAKVEAYLKKRERRTSNDEYLTDSGYRSDSQYSFKSAESAPAQCGGSGRARGGGGCGGGGGGGGGEAGEAAHCLYRHVRGARTGGGDLLNHVARVLGSVIDRHHSEERYPPYIDQLMEHIRELVGGLCGGGGGGGDHILEKDEKLQRLLLLNHSKHILQYTIAQITAILQDIHTKLTTTHLYELENIAHVESMCYIFYLLEILIQRYNSVKNSETIHSSQSQETVLKKSSITDIWKKKWNPNFKETVFEGSQRVCVLSKCSEILNKIVIDCMEGYSLVAFAALQCFNLLQN